MSMIIKYVNSNGQSVNLNKYPYKMLISDILDYDPDVIENNGKIIGFNSDIMTQREVNIDIHRTKTTSARISLSNLTDIFGIDVVARTPGRLYINDWYIPCYFYGRETNRWQTDNIISCEYKILTDHPSWIQEETFQFLPPVSETQEQSETIKAYDYTYDACVYPTERDPSYLINDHYDSCDFRMLVYGPRSQTNITIGENIYHVNYAIQDGEYMVIDSRETAKPGKRVYLVRKNGEKLNLFDYRNPKYSIFAKIPPGTSAVRCGDAGMDITIYKRRSEPKWI